MTCSSVLLAGISDGKGEGEEGIVRRKRRRVRGRGEGDGAREWRSFEI